MRDGLPCDLWECEVMDKWLAGHSFGIRRIWIVMFVAGIVLSALGEAMKP